MGNRLWGKRQGDDGLDVTFYDSSEKIDLALSESVALQFI